MASSGKDDSADVDNLRSYGRVLEKLVEILNVGNLARLGHTMSLFFESLPGVVLHCLFGIIEGS